MALLSRKGLLAVTAVIDIALHGRGRPVSAKILAARHDLPPRHLEPVLQALVRDGILRGVRGPHGGYELARAPAEITANEVMRAAGEVDDDCEPSLSGSAMMTDLVMPALAVAEQAFAAALSRITIGDITARATPASA